MESVDCFCLEGSVFQMPHTEIHVDRTEYKSGEIIQGSIFFHEDHSWEEFTGLDVIFEGTHHTSVHRRINDKSRYYTSTEVIHHDILHFPLDVLKVSPT